MPLKKGGVKSSSKKPLKKEGVKSSSKKPLKKGGVKSSSKMPLKKRGGTDNPPESVLALLAKKGVYALAENMQTAHGPRSVLSAIHGRTPKTPKTPKNPPLENPPLENPQSVLALLAKKGVYALAENMQTAHGPRSVLSAIHGRTPKTPKNPPLEKPPRGLQGLIYSLYRSKRTKRTDEDVFKKKT